VQYKLFSKRHLSDKLLSKVLPGLGVGLCATDALAQVFHNASNVVRHEWAAYPKYSPPGACVRVRANESVTAAATAARREICAHHAAHARVLHQRHRERTQRHGGRAALASRGVQPPSLDLNTVARAQASLVWSKNAALLLREAVNSMTTVRA
jgi:hypothetical protein